MKKITISIVVYISILTNVYNQSKIIGKIFDDQTSQPIVGATISIKGTLIKTMSTSTGDFEILNENIFPITISFDYLGYKSKDIELNKNSSLEVYLSPIQSTLKEVIVSARRRQEIVQNIPIAISIIGNKEISNSTSFNVNRIKELVPFIQLYSSNPRNTSLNIRGIGSTFGLTNDGIDPGVGFYVDGIYYARPAATTFDFIDIQQIEILRGPQGTLFGKNTTAGTFNITSQRPSLTASALFEQTIGNLGFIQTKGSISGPILKNKLFTRFSFSGTQREGTIYNIASGKSTNTLNNQGSKLQLLYLLSNKICILLAGDYSRQRPDGYAQVYAGSVTTMRPDFAQFKSIIADLNYKLPSENPFDRIIDHDTPWRSDQNMGGLSINSDFKLGLGTLTSTSAWRTWKWNPSNDRDFTGLQALKLSQAPSIHHQWTQEFRYAGEFSNKLSGVLGFFAFYQKLDANNEHREESGKDQWRFVQNSQNPLWNTPYLLDGYGIVSKPSLRNFSSAIFGQIDWIVTKKFTIIPGVRINYDQKEVDFKRKTYGGLQTNDQSLLSLQRLVYTDQSFNYDIDDWNLSGQITLTLHTTKSIMIYGTFANGFKPVGLNLGGLPSQNGKPLIELAVIKPERTKNFEIGLKINSSINSKCNLVLFNTDIHNYQTLVQSAQLGVNRGYLANAEHINIKGVELEISTVLFKILKIGSSLSYNDGNYISFTNAPLPLEETGKTINGQQIAYKDISGSRLPGISKWIFSTSVESSVIGKLLGKKGKYFIGSDLYFRSSFSSSPSPSKYLNINAYFLLNARIGFTTEQNFTLYLWSKNLSDTDYFEQLLPGAGNIGHYAAVLGDPRTYGITARYTFIDL